jgi:hypothetical protein
VIGDLASLAILHRGRIRSHGVGKSVSVGLNFDRLPGDGGGYREKTAPRGANRCLVVGEGLAWRKEEGVVGIEGDGFSMSCALAALDQAVSRS